MNPLKHFGISKDNWRKDKRYVHKTEPYACHECGQKKYNFIDLGENEGNTVHPRKLVCRRCGDEE